MKPAQSIDRQNSFSVSVSQEALMAGAYASVLSALALIWLGYREVRSAAAPLNAVSHWRWGRSALYQRKFTGRHTVLGYFIHHCASVWWAAVYAAGRRKWFDANQPMAIAAGALTTSALACLVDFKCTPERLTPGFEHHLSRSGLARVYLAFAGGLMVGAILSRSSAALQK